MLGKKAAIEPEDIVKLKPVLGLRPGVYLAILYGIILLVIAFLILIAPGLVRNGSLVSFESEPWGAALRVNGVYQGSAPSAFFVPAGEQVFTFALPGFTELEVKAEIKGRVFASLFAPRRQSVRAVLKTPDAVKALAEAASEYAAWSMTGEPSAIYQIPLSLSEGVYRTGPAAAQNYGEMNDFLKAAARFAANKVSLRDLLRAKLLLDSKGNAPGPLSLLRSAEDIFGFFSENPEAARWLGESLEIPALTNSAWYKDSEKAAATAAEGSFTGTAGNIRLANHEFRGISGGMTFWISETEVSADDWELFLRENPEWRPEKIDDLTARGLVNEDYLRGEELEGFPSPAVPGVSWHAAAAYCAWLTGKLARAGYEVRLPREAEWEYAARLNENAGGTALDAMLGGLWEWCDDPYAPFPSIKAPPKTVRDMGSPERAVRGGAWINPVSQSGVETRGSLRPEICSPFVSFRPVIAAREALYEQ